MWNSTPDGDPLYELGFLLVLLAIGAIAAAARIRLFTWSLVKGLMTGGWTTTHGRVEFGSVVEHHLRYVGYFVATISYSYTVQNEYYSGNIERAFFRQSTAEGF